MPDLEADERQMYGKAAAPAVLKPAYTLDHALSGIEGVEKVKQTVTEERPARLAFVDIRMPGMDGVETIQRIWERDYHRVRSSFAPPSINVEEIVRRLGPTDNLLVLESFTPLNNIEVTLLAGAFDGEMVSRPTSRAQARANGTAGRPAHSKAPGTPTAISLPKPGHRLLQDETMAERFLWSCWWKMTRRSVRRSVRAWGRIPGGCRQGR